MLKGLICKVIAHVYVMILNGIITSEEVNEAGFKAGMFITRAARKELGQSWEKIEEKNQTILADFVSGFDEGLDVDDTDDSNN